MNLRLNLRSAAFVVVPVLLIGTASAQLLPAQAEPAQDVRPAVLVAEPASAVAEHAGLVMNGDASEVNRVSRGATYLATVKVRTTNPPARGEIVVQETSSTSSVDHSSEFTLNGTSWTTVTTEVVAKLSGATLNLSVHMFDGAEIEAQTSSVTMTAPAPGGSSCAAPLPSGTALGTSMSWDGRTPSVTLAELDREFGTLEAVRLFDPGLPASWSSARAKATAGRTVIISFRPMPKDVLAGKYDKELKAFFADAPTNQTIYWSYIHEPEPLIDNGTFTAAQYRAAWQRIAGFAAQECKSNMYATLILTGWTADPGSKRSVSTYYAGDDVIDVLGWDPYNGVHDPGRDYYISAEALLGNSMRASQAMGKPWAMAETGSRLIPGDSGSKRAAWLTSVGTYLRQNGAVYGTYFNSTRDANWMLDDAPSQQAWAKQIDLG